MKTSFFRKKQTWQLFGVTLALMIASCIVDPDSSDGVRNTNFAAEAPFSLEIDIRSHTRFELEGINGTVEIIGVPDAATVEVWGKRRVESESYSDAEAYLEKLSVQVTELNNKIIVSTRQPQESRGRNFLVFYNVRVPQDWHVKASNVNGEIHIKSLDGSLDTDLTNGELTIESLRGDVGANLVNGNIRLQQLFGNVDVGLVNGNITGEIFLPTPGVCEMSSVNGNIVISMPKTTSADFSARVSNGSITVSNLVLENEIRNNTSLSGILGNGEGEIDLQTVNGNVVVNGM